MEPTANAPRTPDIRTPESTPRADPAPIDPLSSWDGPGTAYTVTPRPAVIPPVPPEREEIKEPDVPRPLSSASPSADRSCLLEPSPRPAVNWPLIAGAVFGTLITALLIALWALDGTPGVPDVQQSAVNASRGTEHPSPASQVQSESGTENIVIATQEPLDDEPLPTPPSEPAAEQLPEPIAHDSQPPPSAEEPAQAPSTAEVAKVQMPTPVQPTTQEQPTNRQTSAPTTTKPVAAPAVAQQHKRPTPTQPMPIADRKPIPAPSPTVRSTPAPAAVGTLIVAVQPWAEVWINGSKRGITPPLLTLQLPPGRYQIELRNPDLPSYSQSLQISAGRSVTLRHSFQ